MSNLINDVKWSIAIAPDTGAAGTSDLNGAILDMLGYEGVLMVVTFGTIDSGAVTTIKAQQDTAAAMGTAADIEGTSQTIADTDDNKTFYIDLFRPTERYVRLVVPRHTANAALNALYCQYGARKAPVTQGTSISGEQFQGPAEGTA